MTCRHCSCVPELEARIEALSDELYDARVALAGLRSVREAEARTTHPSTWLDDPPEEVAIMRKDMMDGLRRLFDRDDADQRGMPRPKLTVVR